MGDLSIGTSVDARFKTNGAFYPGKIKQMNTDYGHLMTATKEKIHIHTIKKKLNIYTIDELPNQHFYYYFIVCFYYLYLLYLSDPHTCILGI